MFPLYLYVKTCVSIDCPRAPCWKLHLLLCTLCLYYYCYLFQLNQKGFGLYLETLHWKSIPSWSDSTEHVAVACDVRTCLHVSAPAWSLAIALLFSLISSFHILKWKKYVKRRKTVEIKLHVPCACFGLETRTKRTRYSRSSNLHPNQP